MSISVLFMIGKRTENSLSPGPSDDTDKNDAYEDSDAVDCHITGGWPPACNKGLVVLIKSSKAHAEYSCHDHEGEASDSVYIEREGHCHCQDKIFRNMPQLAYIMVNAVCIMLDLLLGKILIQHFVGDSDYFDADFIAELAAGNAILFGKLEYHVHDKKGGNKRKRL